MFSERIGAAKKVATSTATRKHQKTYIAHILFSY